MNPLTPISASEMVIPAALAEALRAAPFTPEQEAALKARIEAEYGGRELYIRKRDSVSCRRCVCTRVRIVLAGFAALIGRFCRCWFGSARAQAKVRGACARFLGIPAVVRRAGSKARALARYFGR